MKNQVLIIGAGFMGSALARHFQKHDFIVYIYDQDHHTLSKLSEDKRFENIKFTTSLEKLPSIDFVIEAIPEMLPLKQKMFREIEMLFDEETIFCTNTSSFLISEIGNDMEKKSQLIGTHFFSPADIIPLVEVIPSRWTTEKTIQETMTLLKRVKKSPVLLNEEIPGFIANRLQSALAREAMSLVEKGIVTASELDYIAKWSIGIRLANTGPLEQRDINGIDSHYEIAKYVYPSLEDTKTPLDIHTNMIKEKKYGMKTSSGFYEWNNDKTKETLKDKENVLQKIIWILKSDKKDGENAK